jgi:uncharacterized membrane protein YgaE (UPF0421/DUF939 family)
VAGRVRGGLGRGRIAGRAVAGAADLARAGAAGTARARSVLDEVVHRPGQSFGDRVTRVRGNATLVVQCGLAAGLAWWAATRVVHHHVPFFAPIAAVVVLGASSGHRLRRTLELIMGVAVGIFVGDLLISLIGVGPAQLGAVVALAMAAALFLGSGGPLITQAGSSAVLISTLYPPGNGVYYTRWFDALIGGGIAFAVHALLLPINPLSHLRRAAGPVFAGLADGLDAVADALTAADAAAADRALSALRALEPPLRTFQDALSTADETATVAPVRWRAKGQLALYLTAAPHADHAARNARVLARRGRRALRSREPIPAPLARAPAALAAAVRELHRELEAGREPEHSRAEAVHATHLSALAYRAGVGFSGSVVVAQIQSIAYDLLRASGLDDATAHTINRRTRHAAEAEARAG